MEREEFAEVMAWITAAFPHQEFTAPTVEVYFEMLHDLPSEILKASLVKVAASEEFISPAKVRSAAGDLSPYLLGLPDPYDAWEQVYRAVKDGAGHPITRYVPDLHPLIVKAVDQIGGWTTLSRSEAPHFDKKRFLEAYKMLSTRKREIIQMPKQIRDLAKKLSLPKPGVSND